MMYYHLYMYICIFAGFHLQIFCLGILYICSQGTFICSFLLISLPVWASALCSLKGIGKYCILMYFVKEFTIEITGDTIWAWSFLLDHFVNYKSISFYIYIWCSIAFSFSFFSCITYENVCFSRYLSISSKSGLGTLQPSGHLWPSACLWMLQRCHSYMESFQWGLCRPQCLGCWPSGPLQDLDFQPWSKFSNVLTWIGLQSLTLSLAHLEDLIPSVGGLCSCSLSLCLSLWNQAFSVFILFTSFS